VPLFDPLTFYQQVRSAACHTAYAAQLALLRTPNGGHVWRRHAGLPGQRSCAARACILLPFLHLTGAPLPCLPQVMFEDRSRVKACASPADMAGRWKDAMQASSRMSVCGQERGMSGHFWRACMLPLWWMVDGTPAETTPQAIHPPAPNHPPPLLQRPALRKEHWRRSSPFFSLTRSHAQLVAADEEVFQS